MFIVLIIIISIICGYVINIRDIPLKLMNLYILYTRKNNITPLVLLNDKSAEITTSLPDGKEVVFISPVITVPYKLILHINQNLKFIKIDHDNSTSFIGLPLSPNQIGFSNLNILVNNSPPEGEPNKYYFSNDEKIDWYNILKKVDNKISIEAYD